MSLEEKTTHVREILRAPGPLLIAYSGGVDSTCLLALSTHPLLFLLQAASGGLEHSSADTRRRSALKFIALMIVVTELTLLAITASV